MSIEKERRHTEPMFAKVRGTADVVVSASVSCWDARGEDEVPSRHQYF